MSPETWLAIGTGVTGMLIAIAGMLLQWRKQINDEKAANAKKETDRLAAIAQGKLDDEEAQRKATAMVNDGERTTSDVANAFASAAEAQAAATTTLLAPLLRRIEDTELKLAEQTRLNGDQLLRISELTAQRESDRISISAQGSKLELAEQRLTAQGQQLIAQGQELGRLTIHDRMLTLENQRLIAGLQILTGQIHEMGKEPIYVHKPVEIGDLAATDGNGANPA